MKCTIMKWYNQYYSDANEVRGLEKIIDKYCDHISGARGQRKKAILIQLSAIIADESNGNKKTKGDIGNILIGILDNLLAAKMVGLAGRLLYVCQEQLKVVNLLAKLIKITRTSLE